MAFPRSGSDHMARRDLAGPYSKLRHRWSGPAMDKAADEHGLVAVLPVVTETLPAPAFPPPSSAILAALSTVEFVTPKLKPGCYAIW